jgi:hypothetical protein
LAMLEGQASMRGSALAEYRVLVESSIGVFLWLIIEFYLQILMPSDSSDIT